MIQRLVRVIDSHTGGEPTRVVVSGGPDLGAGPLSERLHRFRSKHDSFRSAVIGEPRGSGIIVGGLLCEPVDQTCTAGVIFFNNVGYLGMCGHGTIGLLVTLAHCGKIGLGDHRIETPVGTVTANLRSSSQVTLTNVPSYRSAANIVVHVPGYGDVCGDVAWGGNWFFLIDEHKLEVAYANVEVLTDFTWRVRQSLVSNGIRGRDGHEIDHIELFGPSRLPGVNRKNFVLCPGKEYDRSPCGTGTGATLACLYADGIIKEGEVWRQESITGSIFEGSVSVQDGLVYPSISGSAYITAEAELIFDPADSFCSGIPI